jgi:hypothetical protein
MEKFLYCQLFSAEWWKKAGVQVRGRQHTGEVAIAERCRKFSMLIAMKERMISEIKMRIFYITTNLIPHQKNEV